MHVLLSLHRSLVDLDCLRFVLVCARQNTILPHLHLPFLVDTRSGGLHDGLELCRSVAVHLIEILKAAYAKELNYVVHTMKII